MHTLITQAFIRFTPYMYLLEGISLGNLAAQDNFFLKKRSVEENSLF